MKPLIHEITQRLRDEFKENINEFEGLYVFGSQVRGDATEDSDVDIVVLFENNSFSLPDPFYDILFQMGIEYHDTVFIDVLPYTREELKRNYNFYDEVVNKGVYYGA